MSTVELNDINERLRSALRMMEELHPRCWREISERRRAYFHEVRGWPDWCYCPLQVIQNFMFRGAVSAPLEVLKAVPILGALAIWRQTQGIYCFDPELLEAVTKSELTNELPAALLSKLPEWCVYVPTPGHIVLSGHRMQGFFAYLDCLKTNGRPELWLVLDEETDDGERVFRSFRLLIGSGTLLECLQSSFADAHADMLKCESRVETGHGRSTTYRLCCRERP